MGRLNDKTAPQDEGELRSQQEAAEKAWHAIGKLEPAGRQQAADAWGAEYGHLYFWCCGSPVFGGAGAEAGYEGSQRGVMYSSQVWWE